ncbi:hypothetical protein [Segniliparus rotundus]|uniref:hypothetical protein n=1 Tax=Segniliparus rotundus TaxID=286802 RepID=UPI0002EEE28D|nr:hypothetical protein [Segniliparus rotundus]
MGADGKDIALPWVERLWSGTADAEDLREIAEKYLPDALTRRGGESTIPSMGFNRIGKTATSTSGSS